MKDYVAIRDCFYGAVLYRKDQPASFPDGETVPHHFRLADPVIEPEPLAEIAPEAAASPARPPRPARARTRKRSAKRSKAKPAAPKIEPAPEMQVGA